MKTTFEAILALCATAFPALADVAGVTITTSGTRQFSPGDEYGSLVNVASGEVVLTSSGGATAAEAISFTSFDAAVGGATTTFSGGWWDFGVSSPSATTVNFMTADSLLSNRSTTLDNGAVVTNVGWAYVAGGGEKTGYGSNNSLTLTGASTLRANSLRLGCYRYSGQMSTVSVLNGSLLDVSGDLSLSDGSSLQKIGQKTGNSLVVRGAGSRLSVGGETSLGRDMSSGSAGAIGGNMLVVADGANASLGVLSVSRQTWHGEQNRIVFGKDSRVAMTSFLLGVGGADNVTTPVGSNVVEILDGAVVTNTGALRFGAPVLSEIGNRIIVSNATFHTDIYSENGYRYLIRGQQNELVLSGADAKFTLANGINSYFRGEGSSLVVENRANYVLPSKNKYSATLECIRESMIFRTGATVSGTSLSTGNDNDTAGTSNRLVVASGASLTLASGFGLVGNYSQLVVDDASLSVGNGLRLGDNGRSDSNAREFTDSAFVIAGSRPQVRIGWDLTCAGNGNPRIVFALPATGYGEGVATAENPIVRCGTGSAEMQLRLSGNAALAFENAVEFGESHTSRRDYVLVESNHLESLTEERLAAASAGFPASMSLEVVQAGSRQQLVLHVSPQKGMRIIFR